MDKAKGRAAFAASESRFWDIVDFLAEVVMPHGDVEEWLNANNVNLMRQLFQDHVDLQTEREPRREGIAGADGVARTRVEKGHRRTLTTIFGDVHVVRLAYRRLGCGNLHPLDASLNLPEEQFSHGLRRRAAIEASRGSFEDAQAAIEQATGQVVGKRQVEELAQLTAVDFQAFYAEAPRVQTQSGDVLVCSMDGKGIVMRPGALRPATAKAAAQSGQKLSTRLSKGEKQGRKRMAEVGAVYDVTPVPRTPQDVLNTSEHQDATPAPKAKNKWLTASVVEDAATVIAQVFDEAERRDPEHRRTWLGLVDGNSHQIDRIQAEAQARSLDVHIVIGVAPVKWTI